ncbi:MAG: RsmB/NOP family class I SAM-dependent RNA methyltransferase [Rhodobacteraceae bacterium]|nr:RsmB/NOP family class I SAM-dependent RNA methyltransferase [Paracoccaceae bacterium]
MKPAARIAAAIDVLDLYLDGAAVEQCLTRWARGARYAGSKDRAGVRDLVFEALRRRRSDSALGGALSGRGLMIGALRRAGANPDDSFSGLAYAPAVLSDEERELGQPPEPGAEQLDIPDWLWPQFHTMPEAAAALQSRAPVYLRVNSLKADRDQAITALARDGIEGAPHAQVETALTIHTGARRIRHSTAYLEGLVELQDLASQAVVQALPLCPGMRVLDYCAGGGGKALAMAAQAKIDLFVHDIAPQRMADLGVRATRAGVTTQTLGTADLGDVAPFDLVLCDAPCSGSGAWRRAPDGKWALTQTRLDQLVGFQHDILRQATELTGKNGIIAYATCSVLDVENAGQIAGFLTDFPQWQVNWQHNWPLQDGADGFYSAHLTRE